MRISPILAALTATFCLGSDSSALGDNVLVNGGFEESPPTSFGNNIGWSIAPWVIAGGSPSNVVQVDGPGFLNYGSAGPESDAEASGPGVPQHYLDITNGSNVIYQAFRPACTGTVDFGGSFSTRANGSGTGTMTLREGVGATGPIVGILNTVSLPGGNSQFDPWTPLSFSAPVVATMPYSIVIEMDNNLNLDDVFACYRQTCSIVGVNKDLLNNTGQPADCIEILLEGSHSGLIHYDGYPANHFANYTESPAPGGNTLLSWTNPNNEVAPGQLAHVGFNLPGTTVTILGVYWSHSGAITGCAHQCSANTHRWGTPGTQVIYANDCLACESIPRYVGDLVVEWYQNEVPLPDLNSTAVRPAMSTSVIQDPPILLAPDASASVDIPPAPTGARFGVLSYKVSADPTLLGPDVTADFLQFGLTDNCPIDAFEDNDTCDAAVPMPDGNYAGLWCAKVDPDWYKLCIPAGGTVTIDAAFSTAEGDVDLFLLDSCSPSSSNIALSASTSDNEQIVYTNPDLTPKEVFLRVEIWIGDPSLGCNEYLLAVSGGAGDCSNNMGTNYCMANANSTGATATMSAQGSTVIADNDVTLTGSDLPAGSFAYFLTSQTRGFVMNPSGSSGNLCIAGAIGRYVGPGQIQLTNASGVISIPADLTQMPQPTGSVFASPGDTWFFQAWFRDASPMGATSNFTDGLEVRFQ